ncbi:MAG: aminoacyl-tRNA hydrolase [Candidatus Cryptobacteroides sp.]|jgi:PTH1 family peptidyl-tRNA hydrolase|nr:aminoacyl-tRNA hydrolase [Bacteroidota bacterium]NLN99560.1 aminoacyl-tRNA hydrolase [Bacteroidales bacterium]
MNYLIAGLGNIGAEYAATRHNMGFMVLDAWAQASNAVFKTKRYGDIAEISFKGRKFTLLKPSTYMNLSGDAVRYWMKRLKLPLENLLVVCDDLNLPFGLIRMRKGGSDGGHNGLKDIQALLETTEYARIRIGIGNNFPRGGQVDHVIGQLTEEEKIQIPGICEQVIEAIKNFATIGPDRAMNFLNTKPKNDTEGV